MSSPSSSGSPRARAVASSSPSSPPPTSVASAASRGGGGGRLKRASWLSPLALAAGVSAQLITLTLYLAATSGTVYWGTLGTWTGGLGLSLPGISTNVVIDKPVTLIVQGSAASAAGLTLRQAELQVNGVSLTSQTCSWESGSISMGSGGSFVVNGNMAVSAGVKALSGGKLVLKNAANLASGCELDATACELTGGSINLADTAQYVIKGAAGNAVTGACVFLANGAAGTGSVHVQGTWSPSSSVTCNCNSTVHPGASIGLLAGGSLNIGSGKYCTAQGSVGGAGTVNIGTNGVLSFENCSPVLAGTYTCGSGASLAIQANAAASTSSAVTVSGAGVLRLNGSLGCTNVVTIGSDCLMAPTASVSASGNGQIVVKGKAMTVLGGVLDFSASTSAPSHVCIGDATGAAASIAIAGSDCEMRGGNIEIKSGGLLHVKAGASGRVSAAANLFGAGSIAVDSTGSLSVHAPTTCGCGTNVQGSLHVHGGGQLNVNGAIVSFTGGRLNCSVPTSAPSHVCIGSASGAAAEVQLAGAGCEIAGGNIEAKATGILRVKAGANGKISAAANLFGAGSLQVDSGGSLSVQAPTTCGCAHHVVSGNVDVHGSGQIKIAGGTTVSLNGGKLNCTGPTVAPSHVCIGADSGAQAALEIAGSNCEIAGGQIEAKAQGILHVKTGGSGRISAAANIFGGGSVAIDNGGSLSVQAPTTCATPIAVAGSLDVHGNGQLAINGNTLTFNGGTIDCSSPTTAHSHVCVGADSGAAASLEIAGSNCELHGGNLEVKATGLVHVKAGAHGKITAAANIFGAGSVNVDSTGSLSVQAPTVCAAPVSVGAGATVSVAGGGQLHVTESNCVINSATLDLSAPTSAPSHVCIGEDSGAAASIELHGNNCEVHGGNIEVKATGALHFKAGGSGKITASTNIFGAGSVTVDSSHPINLQAPLACGAPASIQGSVTVGGAGQLNCSGSTMSLIDTNLDFSAATSAGCHLCVGSPAPSAPPATCEIHGSNGQIKGGRIHIESNGVLRVAASSSGKLAAAVSVAGAGSLEVADSAVLDVGHPFDCSCHNHNVLGSVHIHGSGQLKVTGGVFVVNGGHVDCSVPTSAPTHICVGSDSGAAATLQLAGGAGAAAELKGGSVELKAGGILAVAANGHGRISAEANITGVGSVQIGSGGSLNVEAPCHCGTGGAVHGTVGFGAGGRLNISAGVFSIASGGVLDCSHPVSSPHHVCVGSPAGGAAATLQLEGAGCALAGGNIELKDTGVVRVAAGANGHVTVATRIFGSGSVVIDNGGSISVESPLACETGSHVSGTIGVSGNGQLNVTGGMIINGGILDCTASTSAPSHVCVGADAAGAPPVQLSLQGSGVELRGGKLELKSSAVLAVAAGAVAAVNSAPCHIYGNGSAVVAAGGSLSLNAPVTIETPVTVAGAVHFMSDTAACAFHKVTCAATAAVEIVVASAQHAAVVASGEVALAGKLTVNIGSFRPQSRIVLLSAAKITGQFSDADCVALQTGAHTLGAASAAAAAPLSVPLSQYGAIEYTSTEIAFVPYLAATAASPAAASAAPSLFLLAAALLALLAVSVFDY